MRKKKITNLEEKIRELGNLKLVENTHDKQDDINSKLNIQFKRYKTWVAASTHADEELFCAKSHIELKKMLQKMIN